MYSMWMMTKIYLTMPYVKAHITIVWNTCEFDTWSPSSLSSIFFFIPMRTKRKAAQPCRAHVRTRQRDLWNRRKALEGRPFPHLPARSLTERWSYGSGYIMPLEPRRTLTLLFHRQREYGDITGRKNAPLFRRNVIGRGWIAGKTTMNAKNQSELDVLSPSCTPSRAQFGNWIDQRSPRRSIVTY